MKRLLMLVIMILLIVLGYYKFIYSDTNIKRILKNVEKETFIIDKYVIFGTHFNISGCINNELTGELSLVLKNNKSEIPIESVFTSTNKTCFMTSDKNNLGIYLDSLKLGNYALLVKEVINEKEKYYIIENNSYKDLVYYTVSKNKKNNKIGISSKNYNGKKYIEFDIKHTKLPNEVYDITIDPGHGGRDIGTSYKLDNKVYTESDLTLKISLELKKQLEDLGLKVRITRDKDVMLSNYGPDGRSVIPNKTQSKYSISIHVNSFPGTMNYGGVEVYVPNDIDYDFANALAKNISEIVGYSKKETNKVSEGVYFTYFTKQDIEETRQEQLDKNLKPYDIKEGAPYMFMIREVGGLSTHAYIDGRNESQGYNEFYNSYQTAEPYLIELGYINYEKDLENLSKKSNLFAIAIRKSIEEYLKMTS